MKLKEYRGKSIFEKNSIPIPKGVVISDLKSIDEEIKKLKSEKLIVKAQILTGGRGKAGAIIKTEKKDVVNAVKALLNKKIKEFIVKEILIEETVKIDKEVYISIMTNQSAKNFVLIFSKHGGVDIEEQAEKYPDSILKIPFLKFNVRDVYEKIFDAVKDKVIAEKIAETAGLMSKVLLDYDATLVEINPLALSGNDIIALDSKIIIDDSALYRHKDFEPYKTEEMTDIEKEADKYGIKYVELDGNIAVIGNGAGMVMATLDMLKHFGGKPANFLDIGGGATNEMMEQCLKIAMKKKPKVVFINIFGGITRCDEVAQGLINFRKTNKINIPLVVRMVGTNEEEGRKILEKDNIPYFNSMEECAKKAVELAR